MTTLVNKTRPFGIRDKIGYATGDLGCDISQGFTSTYAMLFFVSCLKIRPEHFAIIIMTVKIFDAIVTPVVGSLCDLRTPGKNGKFKPWITWGSFPLLVTSAAMFIYMPDTAYWARLVFCTVSYMLWSAAFATVNVPYGSMNTVITQDPLQRADLSTFRSIGSMIAQIPVMVLVPLLIFDSDKNPKGSSFFPIILIMASAGFLAMQMLGILVTERIKPEKIDKNTFNYLKTFKEFMQNKPMLGVTISSMAYLGFVGITMSSMQFVFMCYFKKPELLSLGMVIGGFPVLFAVVGSKPLVKRFGKKVACTYPFLIGVAASAVMTFVKIKNPYVWFVLLGFVMLSSGMHMIMTWALAADCVDYQQAKTGRREEGAIFSTFALFRKLSQGIGSAAVAMALKWAGYVAENGANQLAGVSEKIRFTTGLIPLIGTIICFLSMYFLYNIRESHLKGNDNIEQAF